MIQIDTTNILFICGGAFEGIDKIIENRIDKKSIGFEAQIAQRHEEDIDRLLQQILPQDLVKFGLIPELVGRVENVMMDIMYKAPSDENLKYCLVTKEAVLGEKAPSTEKIEARPESA